VLRLQLCLLEIEHQAEQETQWQLEVATGTWETY
jgi:hypothetical protein